jgi:hypothetical protein
MLGAILALVFARHRDHPRRPRPSNGTLALRGLEAGAALLVMVFGVLLLTGFMARARALLAPTDRVTGCCPLATPLDAFARTKKVPSKYQ